jgi:hypothetical protein
LALREHATLGLFKRGRYAVVGLGQGEFSLAEAGLSGVALHPDPLKTVITNIYNDHQLAEIANGKLEIINPVRTVLAQIILEQLNEVCYINVNSLRRGHGPPLSEESWYRPRQAVPRQELVWLDEGNLFCTDQRIVLPSGRFTFIRMDRKVVAVQAYANGVAVQRKREEFATYFAGCYAHEAALVAAYVMAKVPALRPQEADETQPDR